MDTRPPGLTAPLVTEGNRHAPVLNFPLGYSQGAGVAIAYAARHPERVARLILYGGFTRGRLARATTQQERDEAATMCRLAELG